MPTLFSYILPNDAGFAPNPFWGVCTLVTCKPAIRRAAEKGDWIVGLGSSRSSLGDVRGKVVYAMRVSDKMTMHEYDAWVREECPEKIPDMRSKDWRRKLGDAVYDYSEVPPRKRPGLHGREDRERNLRGKFALISDHFYYFGDDPEPLPDHLAEIAYVRRAHRSKTNKRFVEPFEQWIEGLGLRANSLRGDPQMKIFAPTASLAIGNKPQRKPAETGG